MVVNKWCDSCGKVTKWLDGDCVNYKLKEEYYKVMQYTQPFGNEYHEELFDWFLSKLDTTAIIAEDTLSEYLKVRFDTNAPVSYVIHEIEKGDFKKYIKSK
jgi:hypothetical protein